MRTRALPTTPPRRHLLAAVALALLATSGLGGAAAAQPTAPGGDLPACTADPERTPRDCVLPAWPADAAAIEGVFGPIAEGQGTWVVDPAGDAGADGLDILAVGVAPISIDDAKRIRRSDGLLRKGKRAKAVRPGAATLVRIVVDRPWEEVAADHVGIHIATDADGSRSNNAPTAAGRADVPFSGYQDVYSLGYTTTTGKTKLLASDLARGWYKAKDTFAASRPIPTVIDVLLRRPAVGEGLSVVTYASGASEAYDTVSLGPSAIPVDGRVGLTPRCLEGTITNEPFTVRRMIQDGRTVRDVEARASWAGGAAFELTDDERRRLEALVGENDADGDRTIELPATVGLFEEGTVVRQRPDIALRLDGSRADLAVELGLTRRGFSILRDIVVAETGDAETDELLERMVRSFADVLPPFRSARRSGPVAGSGAGSCVPALLAPPPVDAESTTNEA